MKSATACGNGSGGALRCFEGWLEVVVDAAPLQLPLISPLMCRVASASTRMVRASVEGCAMNQPVMPNVSECEDGEARAVVALRATAPVHVVTGLLKHGSPGVMQHRARLTCS